MRLELHGSCMEPVLRHRDWAWIEPLDALPKRGDIVLAQTDRDQLVCHRVLGHSDQGILAAGDRSSEVLEHSVDEIMGRLAAVERNGRPLPFRRRAIDGLLARLHLLARTFHSPVVRRILDGFRRRLLPWRVNGSFSTVAVFLPTPKE